MKKQFFILFALLIPILSFSQGIEFEQGTWKEILAKAKQTHKPVFVDVYTSWCGPCKKMSRDIFPLAEVGKAYNANFVCYQIDAEKGEGIEIAKKYEVHSYPTYLFIKSDGTLFSAAKGSMAAKDFIEVSKAALLEMNDPKPMAVWEKEYEKKKSDPAFLLAYMNKRSKFGKSNSLLFEEYLKLIPEKDRTSDTVAELYKKEGHYLKVNSLAYTNLQKNRETFLLKMLVDLYLFEGMENTIHEAARLKNEGLLTAAVSAYDQVPTMSLFKQKEEIYLEYYQQTAEIDKYLIYASNFCNNYLMKISPDSIEKRDKESLRKTEEEEGRIKSGSYAIDSATLAAVKKFMAIDSAKLVEMIKSLATDTAKLAETKKHVAHAERDRVSQKLNKIAWHVFEMASDTNALQDALRWSKRSLEIYPGNPLYLDTYANLLYKLGRKKEAIAKEKDALNYSNKENMDKSKSYEETLRKMNAGEKTWK
jgi:thiol-disulfide isomerase/thioredoxin